MLKNLPIMLCCTAPKIYVAIMLNKFPYYDQIMLIKFSRAHIILCIMIILLKGFNNRLVTGVASLSFCTIQLL